MSFQDPMGLPGDTTLLLRVYSEHRWLAEELTDLIERVESHAWTLAGKSAGDDELAAEVTALEGMWNEMQRRAAHTDRAFQCVEAAHYEDGMWLVRQTCSYYRWLRNLRDSLATRVEPFLAGSRSSSRAA